MSFRLFSHRLIKHGRHFLHNFYAKRQIHINILQNERNRVVLRNNKVNAEAKDRTLNLAQPVFRNNGLFRFGQHARRLFVDNILSRVTPIYSADLRNEAKKRFLHGDSTTFFALIGISLASGNGILTKDDELESVCWEIREAVARLQHKNILQETTQNMDNDIGLASLDIGPPISKGCSAVVYAASYKGTNDKSTMENNVSPDPPTASEPITIHSEAISPMQNLSPYLHHFGSSVPHLDLTTTGARSDRMDQSDMPEKRVHFDSRRNIVYRERLDSESSRADSPTNNLTQFQETSDSDNGIQRYPLALKMMFNYDIQSNAMAILRGMYKETIPAVNQFMPEADGWEKLLMEQSVRLPPHPNIVLMYGVFCAQVPNLMQASSLYPMALPPRINPNGYGRNMSLFLLMKRYNSSLCEYLSETSELSMRARLLLFTQLLEGGAHLYRYGVAHRDLKSDNILIDLNDNDVHPMLVISDFGCCLANKNSGLCLPYTSHDTDKGGNTALMAPEIICKSPGTFSVLDYSKSDLWACGAIAYEIFGSPNPFYANQEAVDIESAIIDTTLKSTNYKDTDLPALQQNVPLVVRKLVANILHRNPNDRLSPDIAANVMQLFLWAPSAWLQPKTTINSPEILQWLLSLTTKVLYEGWLTPTKPDIKKNAFGLQSTRRQTYAEYLLISSFLLRARLEKIRQGLHWIQQAIDVDVDSI